ncbi:MAG TPA: HAD family hydrolase [Bacteroidia bacterium]|jgi:D-glycero-D-manno-heptose 1,7-bisphosphate phosphatase|nr:HAD family hydrolase [Bacteroidia bacterium]
MNKAIFLDRDGVINVERGYTHRLEDFVILPDVMEVLQEWQNQNFLLIVITNQSGIAKGLYTQEDVECLHSFLMDEFKKHRIRISEIYYCTHHPDVCNCICRKPNSLFVEKGLARFNIDPKQSYFIGDKDRDVEAARKGGVEGILIPSNASLKTVVNRIK